MSLGSALYHAGVSEKVSSAPTLVTSLGMEYEAVATKDARPLWADAAAERAEPWVRDARPMETSLRTEEA
jgi:hypothetical protein